MAAATPTSSSSAGRARAASLAARATLAALSALLVAASRPAPAPEDVLAAALAGSTKAYRGHVMLTRWRGGQARAEEMTIVFSPPSSTRREFLTPDGSVSRVTVSDGETERVRLARGRVLEGDAVGSYEKVMPKDKERELLLANYELQAGAPERVAGRDAWTLTLQPRAPGKLSQEMAVDQETGVVLRLKRFRPGGRFATQSLFTSFEALKEVDPDEFALEAATGAVVASRHLAPDFMTLEQLDKETGRVSKLPSTLPAGFVFESADLFAVGRSSVTHARYTDGLSVVSLFETTRPVKRRHVPDGPAGVPGSLRGSTAGQMQTWVARGRHYTLVGDVSHELLVELSKALGRR